MRDHTRAPNTEGIYVMSTTCLKSTFRENWEGRSSPVWQEWRSLTGVSGVVDNSGGRRDFQHGVCLLIVQLSLQGQVVLVCWAVVGVGQRLKEEDARLVPSFRRCLVCGKNSRFLQRIGDGGGVWGLLKLHHSETSSEGNLGKKAKGIHVLLCGFKEVN